jgi:hypothetical protein
MRGADSHNKSPTREEEYKYLDIIVKSPGAALGRSESAHGTVYQKHRSVQRREAYVYRLTLARCWKVKGTG